MSSTITAHVSSFPIENNHVFTNTTYSHHHMLADQHKKDTAPVYQDMSDEAILYEIACGSGSAVEVLHERYARYAYALAYRIVHESAAAEEIVQDVFLAIWRKATSYRRQQGCVRSWLQAIVHHRAIDYIRASAHRNHQWTPLQAEYDQHLCEEHPDAWEEVWRRERQLLIHRILSQLPLEQRQVIELAYFGGYTHIEIAQGWNIPLGTVKGRMRLGLQRMKLLLLQYGLEISDR